MSKNSKKVVAAVTEETSIVPDQYKHLLETFVKDSAGFPPYYKFENDGDAIFAKVVGLDTKDPEFQRVVMECVDRPIACLKGPVNNAEVVEVQPGEFFTVSTYASLKFSDYLDLPVLFVRKEEVPNKKDPKKSTIVFNVLMAPENHAVVRERRKDEMAMQLAVERRTLSMGSATSQAPQLAS